MSIKTTSLNKNLPLKNYIFNELLNEKNWEESHIYTEIFSKKFMFVVFRKTAPETYVLDYIKFWGFPDSLEADLQKVWQETKDIINRGVELTVRPNGKGGVKVFTNFPKSRKNKILYTKVTPTRRTTKLSLVSLSERVVSRTPTNYPTVAASRSTPSGYPRNSFSRFYAVSGTNNRM